ncbi:protein phosphatase 2C domain-containing protein [Streptomyces spongiae]|uniref:Protein phosphatase 2C domain-containing protein n=1 Tax=Streptomyces spongiae TaxID=565072 RepID=A0A5N8XPX9_9ACTN|nr:protein phosphatase 2C domain-containing protein [Streptomyces spongiae]MPY61444.1 protein phosphatase 2C domain-containing protein [Streptomyces spongiae]
MPDLPTVDAMDQPWYEPPLFTGDAEAALPLLAYDGGQTGSVTVRAGWSAAETCRPRDNCNDAYALWSDAPTGVCFLAVADGVGRSDDAGRAARAAARVAVSAFRARWLHDPVQSGEELDKTVAWVFRDVESTLADLSKRRAGGESYAPDFRSTLVVAALRTDVPPGGGVPVVVARVGDSTAWRVSADMLEPVFGGTSDELGLTAALPGNLTALEGVRLRITDGEVLALTTDGLARDGRDEPVRAFLGRLWAAPPTPLEFLGSLAVRRNDRDDDRAAAVVWFGHYETADRSGPRPG